MFSGCIVCKRTQDGTHLLTSRQIKVNNLVAAFSIRQITEPFVCELHTVSQTQVQHIGTIPKTN